VATRRDDFGAPALSVRVALGALLIKERLGLTDRETVEAIRENPYLQFFIGKEEFDRKPPFDASLMVEFRKRFGEEGLSRIGTAVAMAASWIEPGVIRTTFASCASSKLAKAVMVIPAASKTTRNRAETSST